MLVRDAVLAALAGRRMPLENEKATQSDIALALAAADLDFAREAQLSDGRAQLGAVDFVVRDGDGLIAIEVKLRGSSATVHRQLCRYASDPRVTSLILVTARVVAMPATVAGKPLSIINLGTAWL